MAKSETPKNPCGQKLAEQILSYAKVAHQKSKLIEALQSLKIQIERCTGIGKRQILLKPEHNREL
ncbi:MAG TPA: hypothetical protein PLQ36_00595, partial [Candidatus Gracilibacteria bacterium]|nr:hypothetical protein [Candidatus Gracilibacteria bacterium]